jgi:hypothetical protein
MGLFDSYFDPQQFQDGGGLLGRLLSLRQQQNQYQPEAGSDQRIPSEGPSPTMPQAPVSAAMPQSTMPAPGVTPSGPPTPDYGQTQNVAIGDYQMPQFGRADVSQATQQLPDFGDRLSAGFQSWAHTPVGNPIAAFANGIAGFGSGQRTDPAGIAQQILQPRIDSSGNALHDLHSRYQALRPILGDHNAMLAIVNPEVGKTLITQALSGQIKPANTRDVDPAGNSQPGFTGETTPIAGGPPSGFAAATGVSEPPGYAAPAASILHGINPAGLPRKPRNNFRRSAKL